MKKIIVEPYAQEEHRPRFSNGQRVRVSRRAEDCEQGWPGKWTPEHGQRLGQELVVCAPFAGEGIGCQAPTGGPVLFFPWFVLQPLTCPFYGWELAPFTRVLGRDYEDEAWTPDIFLSYRARDHFPYFCVANAWQLAMPYAGNECFNGRLEDPDQLTDKEIAKMKAYEIAKEKADTPACGQAARLKPFTNVLCRQDDADIWTPDIFKACARDGGDRIWQCFIDDYAQCVPYEGNERLLGTILPAPAPLTGVSQTGRILSR